MAMTFTEKLTEATQASQQVASQILNANTVNGTGVNTKYCQRWIAWVSVGAMTSGASVVVSLQSAATLTGSYTSIPNLSLTAITSTGANTLYSLEIGSDSMPANQPFLRAQAVESGSQNAQVDVILLGMVSNYSPASQNNASNVGQQLAVS